MWQSIKATVGKAFQKHPSLWAVVSFAAAAGNLYLYQIHAETAPIESFFDLAFAVGSFLCFLAFLGVILADLFYKP